MENTQLNILQDPGRIDFATLEDLISKYPWFSLLHIVWLLKYKKERPEDFSTELKKHIIYLHDRKRLFRLINSDLWQKLIMDPAEDTVEKEKILTDGGGNNEKELLEFSYSEEKDKEGDTGSQEKKINDRQDNYSEFTKWIDKLNEKSTAKEHLIERFLEIDPGPIPADKKSQLEGDISKNSVEENESFITDSLARIYISQGLYSKAIFAYEKLSLKYPEKSVYFASQIEKIKNLLSNK